MRSGLSKGNNQDMGARNMFDEMTRSDFGEWRSPNRILEITIHKVRYPITESVLLQVFGRFGKVEDVYVCEVLERVEACVVFQSRHEATEAYGALYGRNIYDGCCLMEIKWGLCQMPPSSAAPTTSPATTTTVVATASPTSIDATTLGSTASVTEYMAATTPLAASAAPTPAPTAPAAAPTTWVNMQPVAPSCPPARAAQGAEEETPNVSPTKCSTQCLSRDIDVLRDFSLDHLQRRGHCVVYSADGRPFEVPLAYLGTVIFGELLMLSQEAFGFASDDGKITLPCDAAVMDDGKITLA